MSAEWAIFWAIIGVGIVLIFGIVEIDKHLRAIRGRLEADAFARFQESLEKS
jgi:hypothetical protein